MLLSISTKEHNGRWGNTNTVPREMSPSQGCPMTAISPQARGDTHHCALWEQLSRAPKKVGLLPTGAWDSQDAGEERFGIAQDLLQDL